MTRSVGYRGPGFWRTTAVATLLVAMFAFGASAVDAQGSPQAPLPAPPGHEVTRMSTTPAEAPPPGVAPEDIIQRFSQKEDQFLSVRPTYGYRKTIRIDEFDPDGKVSGQFLLVTDVTHGANGQVVSKVVDKPQSTLHNFNLEPEDLKDLDRIPPFPITSAQLPKYDLKYLGTEQVDEIDCYIFQVKPKTLEREHNYFDGILWVDTKDLEVVKTYGKWVNEVGDVHPAQLPFTMYETYRENVAGKYWFPSYTRADENLHLKDSTVPMRMVIKWTDFKLLTATMSAPSTTAPSPAASAQPDASNPAPQKP